MDNFYVIWIDLLSHEGVTNYILMLGAGHIGEYLLHHQNLYKHSQQGWEAFNALLKTFFPMHRQRRSREQGNRCEVKNPTNCTMAFPLHAWMTGYDYDCVLEELYNLHDAHDSDNDDLSSYSETMGYNVKNSDFSDDKCEEGMI